MTLLSQYIKAKRTGTKRSARTARAARTYRSAGASSNSNVPTNPTCAQYYAQSNWACRDGKEKSNEAEIKRQTCSLKDGNCEEICCLNPTEQTCATFNANTAINCASRGLTASNVSADNVCTGDECVEVCCNTNTCGNFATAMGCQNNSLTDNTDVTSDATCTTQQDCMEKCCIPDPTIRNCAGSKDLCESAGLEFNAAAGDSTVCSDDDNCKTVCCTGNSTSVELDGTCGGFQSSGGCPNWNKDTSATLQCSKSSSRSAADSCSTKCCTDAGSEDDATFALNECQQKCYPKVGDERTTCLNDCEESGIMAFFNQYKWWIAGGVALLILVILGVVAYTMSNKNKRR